MFRILILVVFVLYIIVIYLLYKKQKFSFTTLCTHYSDKIKNESIYLLKIRHGAILLMYLALILLALSSLLPVMIAGSPLTGIALIIHVTVAPVFILALTLMILLTVQQMRFTKKDYDYIKTDDTDAAYRLDFWQKIHFWIYFVASIFAILAIIFMMYPVFGTTGQENLLDIHIVSTFTLVITVLHNLYIRARI